MPIRFTLALANLMLATTPALAAKDSITIGMVLEPPNLNPTAGAAVALGKRTDPGQ